MNSPHHFDRQRRRLAFIAIAAGSALTVAGARAQGSAAPTRPLMQKYVGGPNSDAMLKEPTVRPQLESMLGKQLPTLMRNLDVRGEVDLIGGALAINGNANHKGGEEEAIVCVADQGPVPLVEAAIFSRGRVTVFAKAPQYDYLMLCIKDWVTQVNSGHRDRMTQPKNVHVVVRP
jgi:hypothetical protein